MKKKSKSILAIVLAILLVIVVAISLTTNILFSRKDTPKIFGHYIYLMEYDTMEAAAGPLPPALPDRLPAQSMTPVLRLRSTSTLL